MVWKVSVLILAAALLPATALAAASPATDEHISVESYDSEVNYLEEMRKCASDGGEYALQVGYIYEQQRNMKIELLGLAQRKTDYFTRCATGGEILIAMKADQLKTEHYVAGEVYEYLKLRGYSDTAVAGILGNMMAECGGQTLELQWGLYGGGGAYYGLCMWSLRYGPTVNGASVRGQLDYLTNDIEAMMRQFGGSHETFCAIEDAGQAARYFCYYYERGAGSSQRARNAYRALEWIQG